MKTSQHLRVRSVQKTGCSSVPSTRPSAFWKSSTSYGVRKPATMSE